MFYIKELTSRFLFAIIVIFFLFSIFYFYGEIILFVFIIPLTNSINIIDTSKEIHHIPCVLLTSIEEDIFSYVSKIMPKDTPSKILYQITLNLLQVLPKENESYLNYTNPTELFETLINLTGFFTILTFFPYTLWSTIDFLRVGLFFFEYKKIKNLSQLTVSIFLVFNIFLYYILFPYIIYFFLSFDSFDKNNIDIRIEFQLLKFLIFSYNIFYMVNIVLIIIILIYLVIKIEGLNFYIRYKKVFFLVSILMATIFTTPEISSQLIVFLFINLFLEFFQLKLLYKIKVNKVAY